MKPQTKAQSTNKGISLLSEKDIREELNQKDPEPVFYTTGLDRDKDILSVKEWSVWPSMRRDKGRADDLSVILSYLVNLIRQQDYGTLKEIKDKSAFIKSEAEEIYQMIYGTKEVKGNKDI